MTARIHFLIFAGLMTVSLAAQDLAAQQAPDPGAGPEAHVEWLLANPQSPLLADVLDRTLSLVTSLSQVDSIRTDVLPNLDDANLRSRVAKQLASVYRTARRFPEAAELYGLAHSWSGGADQ